MDQFRSFHYTVLSWDFRMTLARRLVSRKGFGFGKKGVFFSLDKT